VWRVEGRRCEFALLEILKLILCWINGEVRDSNPIRGRFGFAYNLGQQRQPACPTAQTMLQGELPGKSLPFTIDDDEMIVALVAVPRAVSSQPTVTAPGGSSRSAASATVPCMSQSDRRQASTQGKESAKVLFYQHFGRIVGALVLFSRPEYTTTQQLIAECSMFRRVRFRQIKAPCCTK
jgi:hypothetical protein